MFDTGKTGFIDSSKIATILNTLGHNFDDEELQALIEGHDPESMCTKIIMIPTPTCYQKPQYLARPLYHPHLWHLRS
jgi:hypothetical protein